MKKLSRKYMRENFHKLGVVQFGYRIPADKPITEALKEAMISLRKNYDLKNVTMNNVIYTSDSFIRMRKNGTYSQVFLKKVLLSIYMRIFFMLDKYRKKNMVIALSAVRSILQGKLG